MADYDPYKFTKEAGQDGARLIGLKSLKDPVVLAVFDYWKEKRGDRLMPSPDDLRPSEFARYLPHLQIVEVHWEPEFDLIYRILGEDIAEVHGGPFRGLKVRALNETNPGLGSMMFELFRAVAEHKRPYAAGGVLNSRSGEKVPFEGLYMPLSHDDTRTNRIFCCSSYNLTERSLFSGR